MKVLICEKEEILLNSIKLRLGRKGFESITTSDEKEALQLVKKEQPDILVLDIDLNSPPSEKIIETIKTEWKLNLPIIIIASLEEEEKIMHAIRSGVSDFILKPFKPKELLLRIQIVMEAQKIEASQSG